MDMLKGIVAILLHSKAEKPLGTGFFISDGSILTCGHVVEPHHSQGRLVSFQIEDEAEVLEASIVYYSGEEEFDLAVLRPTRQVEYHPLPLVSSTKSQGHDFVIYGYPELGQHRGFNGAGKVLGWIHDARGFKILQLDCRQVTHGFSGAPVWDQAAQAVIGILEKGITINEIGRPSFALPMELAREAFPDLPVGPAPEPARAGATGARLFQLPPPPADFTGREKEIEEILADFEGGRGAPISGLTGFGGTGKTALGLVVADQLAARYPDAQIFLDLKGTTAPLSALAIMRHVVLSFEPEANVGALDEASLAAAYRDVLHGKKALLFLDNARSADQIEPLRPPASCGMLVTSRWTFATAGLKSHRVGVLEPDKARDYLLAACERIGEQAADLAEACGRLPLALKIAASFLAVNPGQSVDKYLQELHDRKRRMGALARGHDEAELKADPDVQAAFELSYKALDEEDARRWRRLGVFPAPFTLQAAASVWEMEEEATRVALSRLCRYSLVDYNEKMERYDLHDLLADFAIGRMEEGEEDEARLAHANYYVQVLAAADELFLQGSEHILEGLRLFDQEWFHIQTGQRWSASKREESEQAAGLCVSYPDAGAYCIDLRLHPRRRIEWLEAAVEGGRKLGDRWREGNALGNLGLAYADLGEMRKAIEFY